MRNRIDDGHRVQRQKCGKFPPHILERPRLNLDHCLPVKNIRNKILNSMIRAFDKRKVDVTDLDRITTEIEQTIQNTLEREISTDKIGEMVMERLKPLDEVAYIRFASIYHRFQDAGSFMREISKFLEEK